MNLPLEQSKSERCFYCAQTHANHPNAMCDGYRAESAGAPEQSIRLRRCREYGEYHGVEPHCHCDAVGGSEEVTVFPAARAVAIRAEQTQEIVAWLRRAIGSSQARDCARLIERAAEEGEL